MIWQIGESLPFDFAYLASKLGKTGIAVTIKAAYKNGVAIPALVGVAIPEIGNGLFRYLLDGATYVDAAGDYVIIATTADTSVDQRDLYAVNVVTPWVADVDAAISTRATQADILSDATPFAGANIDAVISSRAVAGDAMALTAGERTATGDAVWGNATGLAVQDQLDTIQAHTDLIGTGTAVVVAPVLASGNVDMIVGDVYDAADSRSFDWTSDDWNIAVASVVVVIVQGVAVFTAERISATAVRLELTAAQSATIAPGRHTFYIREIQSDAEPITRLTGIWVARQEPAPMPATP